MTSATELLGKSSTTLKAALEDGVATLSRSSTVTFTLYVRLVLPLDGFVFWVKSDLVAPAALLNATKLDSRVLLGGAKTQKSAQTLTVEGSLHWSVDQRQLEDETIGYSQVMFTTSSEVQILSALQPETMWVGELPDGRKFAFNRQGRFYQAAGLYHYVGEAIYPALASQLVSSPADFDARSVVVSNSLPAWLALNNYLPPYYPDGFGNVMPLYPSFAVPLNLPSPAYGSVHIEPSQTTAIQAVPWLDKNLSSWQLCTDVVRITLYGARNNAASDFLNAVLQYSVDTEAFGIMSSGVIQDEKRNMDTFGILATKKTLVFEVSYYQSRVNSVARRYTLSCVPTYTPAD